MTQQQSRFSFPGFIFTGAEDTVDYQVEHGTIISGGVVFALHLIRNKQYTNLNFLIKQVMDADGALLWEYPASGLTGVAVLAHTEEGCVIASLGNGKTGKVEEVIALNSLGSGSPTDVRQRIKLKRAAGRFLDREVSFTPIEKKLNDVDARRLAEQRFIENAEAEAARAAAREQRVRTLLARGRLTAYAADGSPRYGIPVLESEWPSVTGGTSVIVVKSIDEKTGAIGEPMEAFKVSKTPGRNPQKGYPVVVTKEQPVRASAANTTIKPMSTELIETGDGVYEVHVFSTMDAIKTARANGLNGGTYVAAKDQMSPDGTMLVYSVHHDRVDTVGKYAPL